MMFSQASVPDTIVEDIIKSIRVEHPREFDQVRLQKEGIEYVLDTLRLNPFLYGALQVGGVGIDPTWQNDRRVVILVLSLNGHFLEYMDKFWKGDKEAVQTAVTQEPMSLEYVPKSNSSYPDYAKFYQDLVNLAVSKNGLALQYASADLKKNESTVLRAVSQNGMALQYADDVFRNKINIVREAVRQDARAICLASRSLKWNDTIMTSAIRRWENAIYQVPDANTERQQEIYKSMLEIHNHVWNT